MCVLYYQEARNLENEYTENATCIQRAFGSGTFKEKRISVGRATPGRQSQAVPTIDVYPLCPPDPFSPSFWLSRIQRFSMEGEHLWTSIKYRNEPSKRKKEKEGFERVEPDPHRPGPRPREIRSGVRWEK